MSSDISDETMNSFHFIDMTQSNSILTKFRHRDPNLVSRRNPFDFNKKFIFQVVNTTDSHWYTVITCYPGNLQYQLKYHSKTCSEDEKAELGEKECPMVIGLCSMNSLKDNVLRERKEAILHWLTRQWEKKEGTKDDGPYFDALLDSLLHLDKSNSMPSIIYSGKVIRLNYSLW